MVYHAKQINNAVTFADLALAEVSLLNAPLTSKQKRTLGFILKAAYPAAAKVYMKPSRLMREKQRAKRARNKKIKTFFNNLVKAFLV